MMTTRPSASDGAKAPQVPFEIGLLWLVTCVSFIGCVPAPEKSVVIYCAADREYAAPILDAYERNANGTEVVRQFDVESSKTLGLVTRIERESERPRCDVFWNNEILHTIRLQKAGLLAPVRWQIPDNWPKGFRASDDTWVGFAARARILLINKDRCPEPNAWPQSVLELSDPRWKGECGIAFPMYGTTATHMAVLASHPNLFGKQAGWAEWGRECKKNAVVLSGNKQVALAVASGELAWGLTDTDDAIIEQENGRPVAIVFPDQMAGGIGTLFIPNSIAVTKNAPHPTAARSLANYLVSEKIESRLVMSSSAHFPLWPNPPEKSRLQSSQSIRWAEVNFETAAEAWPETSEQIKQIFE